MKTLNNFVKMFFWAFYVLLTASVCFLIFSIVFLAVAYLGTYGFTQENVDYLIDYWINFNGTYESAAQAYYDWFMELKNNFERKDVSPYMLVPFLAPALFFVVTIWAYLRSPYYFSVWYKFNNHFATDDEIKSIGLYEGPLMALGCFDDKIISPTGYSSVFCWASSGMGKTTSVSIPSIFESDMASIFAVDVEGNLARLTSGYRGTIGPVFYFDWSKRDNLDTGEVYPRWNPLSPKNLPPKGQYRDAYLASVAKNLLSKTDNSYWHRLTNLAMEGMLNCFVSKIEQACANDYFLSKLMDKGRLSSDDKDVLLSYYALMPKKYTEEAVEKLKKDKLTIDNYMPIGSWGEVPQEWRGKELSLPMCADCLTQLYFMITKESDDKVYDGWKIVLGKFIKEAKFFGYHHRSIQILEYLFYLSPQQRGVVFTMFLEPLMVFRDKAIRERTSVSDFSNDDLRGMKDASTHKTTPITIYSVASNSNSKFMTKFMIDTLIDCNIELAGYAENIMPVLFVLDDFENLPKLDSLQEGLVHGRQDKMTFLLLTDGLSKLEETYGLEGLEDVISTATYKLLTADNNTRLAENLLRMAKYGEKTVQIPAVGAKELSKMKHAFSDANYYRQIAKEIGTPGKLGIGGKGQYMLLAEGYYHLPIWMESLHYTNYEELVEKANLEPIYSLEEKIYDRRNAQDMEPPELVEVLKEGGVYVSKEEEVEEYIKNRYEETMKRIETLQDKKSIFAEDVSDRWKCRDDENEDNKECDAGDEWWLEEDAFSTPSNSDENPFN